MISGASDIAAACVDCQTIFLLPRAPDDEGIAGGRAPVGLCTRCDGLVIAIDAAERHLADLIHVIRSAGSLHFATLLQLVESWQVAPPSPLAALAELGPVGPDVLDVFDVGPAGASARRAIGSLLVLTLPALMVAAAGHGDPDTLAARLLDGCVTPGTPRPLVR
jgi:hypothetical protein